MITVKKEKEKNMTWQQRFDRVVNRIRNQVEACSGITEEEIETAIQRVRRKKIGSLNLFGDNPPAPLWKGDSSTS